MNMPDLVYLLFYSTVSRKKRKFSEIYQKVADVGQLLLKLGTKHRDLTVISTVRLQTHVHT